jgi:polyhydroxyalkanoate synthesis regulator protein
MAIQSTSEQPIDLIDQASRHSENVVQPRWQLFRLINQSLTGHSSSIKTNSSDITTLQGQIATLQEQVKKLQGS